MGSEKKLNSNRKLVDFSYICPVCDVTWHVQRSWLAANPAVMQMNTDCITSFWKDSFSLGNVKKRAAEERQIWGLSACVSVRFAQKLLCVSGVSCVSVWTQSVNTRRIWEDLIPARSEPDGNHTQLRWRQDLYDCICDETQTRTFSSRCWSAGVHCSLIRSDPGPLQTDQRFTVVQVR